MAKAATTKRAVGSAEAAGQTYPLHATQIVHESKCFGVCADCENIFHRIRKLELDMAALQEKIWHLVH